MKATTKKLLLKKDGFSISFTINATGLPVMKSALRSLGKSVLLPLKLTTAVSETEAVIQKKIFVFGMRTLIISNEELDDIRKVVKSLEESGFFDKGC